MVSFLGSRHPTLESSNPQNTDVSTSRLREHLFASKEHHQPRSSSSGNNHLQTAEVIKKLTVGEPWYGSSSNRDSKAVSIGHNPGSVASHSSNQVTSVAGPDTTHQIGTYQTTPHQAEQAESVYRQPGSYHDSRHSQELVPPDEQPLMVVRRTNVTSDLTKENPDQDYEYFYYYYYDYVDPEELETNMIEHLPTPSYMNGSEEKREELPKANDSSSEK